MEQKLNKMRILSVELPWYLEEYNRQFDKELVEIHFAYESIFHGEYSNGVDPEFQGFMITHQQGSLDHFKVIWNMSKFKCDGTDKRIALSKLLKGKYFMANNFRYSVEYLLSRCGINGRLIRIMNSDTICNFLYKVYIGQSVDEEKAVRDMVSLLRKHLTERNIEVVKEIDSTPQMLSTDEFYLTDLDYDEYYQYLRGYEIYPHEERGQWTKDDYEWAYASAFEFCPENQYGIID